MVDPTHCRRRLSSKESRGVSTETGSTEAVRSITDREREALRRGRQAEENHNFRRPDLDDTRPDDADAHAARRHNTVFLKPLQKLCPSLGTGEMRSN